MKILNVWCDVEIPCPKCQKPMRRAGKAPVIDGRIGPPELCTALNPDNQCDSCVREANREAAKKRRPPKLKLA